MTAEGGSRVARLCLGRCPCNRDSGCNRCCTAPVLALNPLASWEMGIYPKPRHSLCRYRAVRRYATALAPPSREQPGARSAHHQRNCLARTEDILAVCACRAGSPLAACQARRGKRACASPPAQGSYLCWPQITRDGNQTSISKTPWGCKVFKNSAVLRKSNFLSRAFTTRKKRSFEASANLATLKTG